MFLVAGSCASGMSLKSLFLTHLSSGKLAATVATSGEAAGASGAALSTLPDGNHGENVSEALKHD